MNKAWKKKWVNALRSGDYGQTKAVLKDSQGYCCLGVLRELITPRSKACHPDFDALCKSHAKLVGLPNYEHTDDNPQNVLATMNDDGKTFAEIADYIEANL